MAQETEQQRKSHYDRRLLSYLIAGARLNGCTVRHLVGGGYSIVTPDGRDRLFWADGQAAWRGEDGFPGPRERADVVQYLRTLQPILTEETPR